VETQRLRRLKKITNPVWAKSDFM